MMTYEDTLPAAQHPDLLREAQARLPRRRNTKPRLLDHLSRSTALLARCRDDDLDLSTRLLDATSRIVAKAFACDSKANSVRVQRPAPKNGELNSNFFANPLQPAETRAAKTSPRYRRKRVLIPPALRGTKAVGLAAPKAKAGAPAGNQNAFKHGRFTGARRALRAEIRAHIVGGRALLANIPHPLKTAQNNYVAEQGHRRVGAPRGNRNAALKPEVVAYRAEAAALMTRARLALARLKLAMAAAKALPQRTTTIHEHIENGALLRRITVQSGPNPMVTREIFGARPATRIRLCEGPRAVITGPRSARIESVVPAAPAPGAGPSWHGLPVSGRSSSVYRLSR